MNALLGVAHLLLLLVSVGLLCLRPVAAGEHQSVDTEDDEFLPSDGVVLGLGQRMDRAYSSSCC